MNATCYMRIFAVSFVAVLALMTFVSTVGRESEKQADQLSDLHSLKRNEVAGVSGVRVQGILKRGVCVIVHFKDGSTSAPILVPQESCQKVQDDLNARSIPIWSTDPHSRSLSDWLACWQILLTTPDY